MARRRGGISRKSPKSPVTVAYLFGAGATHAELANAYGAKMQNEAFLEKNSLLLSNVSKRVCRDARNDKTFPKSIKKMISRHGLSNLELFISLLEKNQVSSTEKEGRKLKEMLGQDIQSRLRASQPSFYLHKALFEFH